MIFAVQNNELNGIVNLGAPEQVKIEQLMHELRDAVDAPFGLPSPKWMLEIGAVFMGIERELLLKSRWIEPEKLKAAGFHWEFPTLEKALAELCAKDLFAATVSKPIVAH